MTEHGSSKSYEHKIIIASMFVSVLLVSKFSYCCVEADSVCKVEKASPVIFHCGVP